MQALRLTALALSLATAFLSTPAVADLTAPPLPLGTPGFSNLYGLELNQWYVYANQNTAGTLVDGKTTQDGALTIFPTGTDLTRRAETSQVSGSKQASALATVSPTSLGAAASAHDPVNLFSNGTLAVGQASMMFAAVLDQNTSFKFDIKLNGHLDANDQHKLGPDVAGAAVSALVFGSTPNYKTEDMVTTFNAAGLDPYAEGEAFIRQYSALQSSTQAHMDTFGAQTSPIHDLVNVNTTMHVSVDGTYQDCDRQLSPACGRYVYFFNVMLFTAAQDGGLADFSHTLQVSSYSVGGGAAQPFSAVSAVPEPATAPLLALGIVGVLGAAARRRQRP